MRYLVITFDADENQTMYDFVRAETPEKAVEIIEEVRDYGNVVAVYTAEELRKTADDLMALSDAALDAQLAELREG